MTIQLHPIADHAAYQEKLYQFLKTVEGKAYDVYVLKGVPHNGIGFNIAEDPALDAVILAFGINPNRQELLNQAQRDREVYYRGEIRKLLENKKNMTSNPQSALDQIMYNRSVDPIYNGTTFYRQPTFVFNSNDNDAQLKVAFNEIIPRYEKRVHDWLGSAVMDADSNERTALVSMAYQGWINVGKSQLLKRAIVNGDRAEAWYEIRYNTNVEARRFLEADTFGLYNSGPLGEADYKAAYRTLTRHRTKIFGADGEAGTADDYEEKRNPDNNNIRYLDTAISFGNDPTVLVAVKNLNAHLAQAQEYLAGTYGVGIPVDWSNIFVGEDVTTTYYRGSDHDTELVGSEQNDLIFGESGNDIIQGWTGDDVIYGGSGDDTLNGQQGDDYLDGGPGNDTYYYVAGSGHDTIHDPNWGPFTSTMLAA